MVSRFGVGQDSRLSMGQARAAQPDSYVPFRTRFLAWWHGLDPEAVVKHPGEAKELGSQTIEIDHEPTPEELDGIRRELLQLLWGEGFIEPGGADYTLKLLKPTAPSPDKTVLDLAAGLCGGAKAISDKYGLWLDAMEPDPRLLAAAEAFCERKGLSNKIKLSGCDMDAPQVPKKKYDSIYARERFYLFPDKRVLLNAIVGGLKPGGQLVFTDLVLEDRGQEKEAVKVWREALPVRPYLWTKKEYEVALRELKFDVRIFADETDSFRGNVLRGWSDFASALNDDTLVRQFVDVLVTEAEQWQHQVRALESGQVRFLRVHAIFHGNKIRLMSDP